MANVKREKIAVLGGGIAGLTAAYELSKTKELQDKYEVTIYQMGWRLGGKASTGRGPEGQIQEHGLHFWFGCYENAFRMLKEVYTARPLRPDDPLKDWRCALKPQNFTPMGVLFKGEPAYWPITWPQFGGAVGDGREITISYALETLLGFLADIAQHWQQFTRFIVRGELTPAIDPTAALRREQVTPLAIDAHLQSLAGVENLLPDVVRTLGGTIESLLNTLRILPVSETTRPVHEALVIGYAFCKGVVLDIILGHDLERLERVEFRDWLIRHGADRSVVADSTLLRSLYDMCMQYKDGDPQSPNFAAGTAIIVFLRLLCTCKEDFIWAMQSGMGEVVIAPLYEVLIQNKVQFRFFRKVKQLTLSADRKSVRRISLAVQAKPSGASYTPTRFINGLRYWPAEPFWDELEHGDQIKRAGVNFESHWYDWPDADPETLELGDGFDKVVLALSLGAFKQLNPADHSLAADLAQANPKFGAMTNQIGLIPTLALQIWCDADLNGLGWKLDPPATVAGPEALSVWADMTHTLRYEPWPDPRPKSVEYFCGVYRTDLFKKPSTETKVPKTASDEVKAQALAYLKRYAYTFLPELGSDKGVIQWDLLHDQTGGSGAARFDQQYWRANVSPNECCPGSAAGATPYRLRAGESGFKNLYLAGCWVRTGLNTTCIEGAVMAGMQAARAISGSPQNIPGENFLREFGALGGGK